MNEMIERLAKVAQRWQGHPGVPASAYEPLARLMIEAMRQATPVMIDAGRTSVNPEAEYHGANAADCWEYMIDAALSNGE